MPAMGAEQMVLHTEKSRLTEDRLAQGSEAHVLGLLRFPKDYKAPPSTLTLTHSSIYNPTTHLPIHQPANYPSI